MSVLEKKLHVTMPDNSVWAVPVSIIAVHHAKYYSALDGVSFTQSLDENTTPLFTHDHFEIEDWAANNMNWSDVRPHAICVKQGNIDFDEGWANGEKDIVGANNDNN